MEELKIVSDLFYLVSRLKADDFHKRLDEEFKIVLENAIKEGIIKGKPSKNKFTKSGYDLAHYNDESGVHCAYIRRNGERVSEIIKML